MGRGVKRVVEAEKGREGESREVEAGCGHEHVERGGRERGRGREEPKRAREKQAGNAKRAGKRAREKGKRVRERGAGK